MLDNTQLNDYFERSKLSSKAIQKIHQIRSSEPERRVFSGPANVACHFASKKMGFTIQAESHGNELPAVVGWEFDDHTYEIYDQPQQVKLTYTGKTGRKSTHYSTPDYFLLQEWFVGWVECKTEAELLKSLASGSQRFTRDESGKWRCPAGESYAAEYGLQFAVRSSSENNHTFIRNLELLGDYFDEKCLPVSEEQIAEVMAAFQEHAWTDFQSLIEMGLDADVLNKMLADQLLYFDINNDLLADAHLTLIYRDKQAADAYRIHIQSKTNCVSTPSASVKIAIGENFIWDGVSWKILNVGDTTIFVEDAEKTIVTLQRNVLEQLIKDGIVSGLPQEQFPEQTLAEELVREASPSEYAEALKRYKNIFPEKESDVTARPRTIRLWKAKYRHSEKAYGSGFVGLIPKTHLRGSRERKLDAQVISIMSEVIDGYFLLPGGRSKTSCWGEVELQCIEQGLNTPSERTFLAEIKRIASNLVQEAREGKKAAYSESEWFWLLDQSTPRHGDRVFEIGHIDHTELDLQFVGSKFGENLNKAWLTVLMDAYTRVILAWVLTFDKPSYRTCMLIIRECVKRHGRIPKTIVVDQGSEFLSVYFDCLIARLESNKKVRPASKPRFGSIIERFFGINNETFIHNLRGNNVALQNPRSLSKSHDPRALAVWTLPKFSEAFEGYVTKVYHVMEHASLGVSPDKAMTVSLKTSGIRSHMATPYTRDFIIMCLPTTSKGTGKVDSSRGVKINHIYYWSPEFRNPKFANKQVEVRYDPFNMSMAMAWLSDHWVECKSEYAAEFKNRTEIEIKNATQEVRAKFIRSSKRRAINAQIIAAYFRDVTKTEEGMLAEQRKLESMEAMDLIALKENNIKQFPNATPIPNVSMWDNITTRIIGEFTL